MLQIYTKRKIINLQEMKWNHAQMRIEKNTAQLHARCHFILILEYELYSSLKTLLWL